MAKNQLKRKKSLKNNKKKILKINTKKKNRGTKKTIKNKRNKTIKNKRKKGKKTNKKKKGGAVDCSTMGPFARVKCLANVAREAAEKKAKEMKEKAEELKVQAQEKAAELKAQAEEMKEKAKDKMESSGLNAKMDAAVAKAAELKAQAKEMKDKAAAAAKDININPGEAMEKAKKKVAEMAEKSGLADTMNAAVAKGVELKAGLSETIADNKSVPLPTGWTSGKDGDGNTYYISPENISQWEKPTE
jgi:hypothetical protein